MEYLANADTWLSHECRLVKAGEEFETTFPKGPDGRPMVLKGNIEEVKAKSKKDDKPDEIV